MEALYTIGAFLLQPIIASEAIARVPLEKKTGESNVSTLAITGQGHTINHFMPRYSSHEKINNSFNVP